MTCIKKVTEDVVYNCFDRAKRGLYGAKALLVNFSEIDKENSVVNGAVVERLVLTENSRGFALAWYRDLASINSSFSPSTEDEDGFKHNFICSIPTSTAQNSEFAKDLRESRFVLIVETRYKGENLEDAFKVLGWENGIMLSELNYDTAINSSSITFTASTEEGFNEQFPYSIYLDTDYNTTKELFNNYLLQYKNAFEQLFYEMRDTAIIAFDVPNASDERYTSIVYVDPTKELNGVGSLADPLNAYPAILVADTAYLQKRGTTANVPWTSQSNDNVLIGAYGTGVRPEIVISGNNRLKLYGDTLVIRDIKINNISIGAYPFVLTDQHWIFNCECQYIGMFGSLTWSKIIGNEIHGSDYELLWMSGADLSPLVGFNVEVAWNNMYDANMIWEPGASQGVANGDAIQFSGANGLVHIHNNIIDRSSTGNKFNIILGEPSSPEFDVLIEDNIFYPPIYTDQGGASLYLKTIIGDCTVRNNVFLNESDGKLSNIYSEDGDLEAYGNLIVGFDSEVNRAVNGFFNNTVIDCDILYSGNSTVCVNSIFSTNYNNSIGANNLFVDEEGSENLFIDEQTYKIKADSIAVDSGIYIYQLDNWIKDFWQTARNESIHSVGSFFPEAVDVNTPCEDNLLNWATGVTYKDVDDTYKIVDSIAGNDLIVKSPILKLNGVDNYAVIPNTKSHGASFYVYVKFIFNGVQAIYDGICGNQIAASGERTHILGTSNTIINILHQQSIGDIYQYNFETAIVGELYEILLIVDNHDFSVYVNGVLLSNQTISVVSTSDFSNNFVIGNLNEPSNNPRAGAFSKSDILEIKADNFKTLSPAEIADPSLITDSDIHIRGENNGSTVTNSADGSQITINGTLTNLHQHSEHQEPLYFVDYYVFTDNSAPTDVSKNRCVRVGSQVTPPSITGYTYSEVRTGSTQLQEAGSILNYPTVQSLIDADVSEKLYTTGVANDLLLNDIKGMSDNVFVKDSNNEILFYDENNEPTGACLSQTETYIEQ